MEWTEEICEYLGEDGCVRWIRVCCLNPMCIDDNKVVDVFAI
jgi:hypothetical protein